MKHLIGTALGLLFSFTASANFAHAQFATINDPALNERINLLGHGGPVSGEFSIAAGQSQVLQFDTNIDHALISNPTIADIIPMSDQSLYIIGKANGRTSLTLFDDDKKLLGVFGVDVTYDLSQLRQRIFELAPGENISVRTNGDSILLSGSASSASVATLAADLADQHAPGKVMNAIQTNTSQQVMLSVKIAEVQRTASKALGLSTDAFFNNGKDTLTFLSGVVNPESFARALGTVQVGEFNVQLFFDALEDDGVLTTLAEPNLVAVSGETAFFLAGGEFPVPIAESRSEDRIGVTVEFKEFGVKLAYTPTVIGDTINLVIEPEVSTLDPSAGIQLENIIIPGLVTRRASTTVELKNGQSFAIAGLLQETFQDRVRQIPGIGKIPILGALARSSSYEKNETELLIIVTPYIVEPTENLDYNLPTDNVTKPDDAQLFFGGQVELGRPE